MSQFPPIESFVLPNGLQGYVLPSKRVPLVVHTLWYRVGSADENFGRSGLAHLFEHLMFQGTKKYPQFSKIVAQNGGQENAFTSKDYTGYYQVVAPKHLEQMMEMEADRMQNLVFSDSSIEREKKVVLEERFMRTESTPAARMREVAQATLFLNHPYGRPIIGWSEEIKQLEKPALEEFYAHWYQPKNAILFVVGNVSASQVQEMAEKTYGSIPGTPVDFRTRPPEPAKQVPREVILQDKEVPEPQLEVMYQAPCMRLAKGREAVALEIFAALLNRPGGRMERELVEKSNAPASRFVAGYNSSQRDIGIFHLVAIPRAGVSLEELAEKMYQEIDALLSEKIQEQDLSELKQAFLDSILIARDDFPSFASFLGGAFASDITLPEIRRWPEKILKLEEEEIKQTAKELLQSKSRVQARLLPDTTRDNV